MKTALLLITLVSAPVHAAIGKCSHLLASLARTEARDVVVELRYADLDPYGHVSSSRYLELLGSALWKDSLGANAPSDDRSITTLDIAFKRAIRGVPSVIVSLSGDGAATGFRITSSDGSVEHATGKLETSPEAAVYTHPQTTPNAPVIYRAEMGIRYEDLNSHGELDLGKYLELITASRFRFFKDHFDLTGDDLLKRGLAFYNTSMHIRFHEPVVGPVRLQISSWVAELRGDDTEMVIPFRVQSASGETVHASGYFLCAPISVATGKPQKTALPDWARGYFIEAGAK